MNKKKALDISGFDDLNSVPSEQAVIDGAGTGEVKTKPKKDEPPKVIQRPHAKNGANKVWILNDIDPKVEKRKRNKHGTAINIPVFVEEFIAIEKIFEAALDAGQTESFADYIRTVLVDHAKNKLGKVEFEKIEKLKYNQVILKKENFEE